MSDKNPTIAYLTAGAAGMFCGSCLRDNTLAAGLMQLGWDVHLIPTYTPIRTDEEDVSDPTVLFGGVNVYLQQKLAFFRILPAFMDRWLDNPRLINWLASRAMETDAKQLGALTVSMLKGEQGNQRKEVKRLVDWLDRHVRPDLINLSNVLIAGCIPALKSRFRCPIVVTLQGDDVFLNDLPQPYRSQACEQIRNLSEHIDCYLTFSEYYRDFMSELLSLPRDRFRIVSMGIRVEDFLINGQGGGPFSGRSSALRSPTIGYLARICPEKGLHVLTQAFCLLREMPGMDGVRLQMAGWLGKRDEAYFEEEKRRLRSYGFLEGPDADFHYAGAVDRHQKVRFLTGLDVLSVPTVYQDPKGLFVLEALASGVPVVQPEHGAFPELLRATNGGLLVRPNDPVHLAESLHRLLSDSGSRLEIARLGRETVHAMFNVQRMTAQTAAVYEELMGKR